MKYDFDQYIERRDSDSIKWQFYDTDVLPLWVADMDFVTAQPIIDALQKRVQHGIFGYTSPKLIPSLYSTVQARMKTLYNWDVSIDDILFLPGVVNGFNIACHAVGKPGDGVLIQPPVYYPFFSAPPNANRQSQLVQVQEHGGQYELDYDAFESAITDCTSLFLFCNPHNPIGRVYKRGELQRLAEICLRHQVVICSDEIHCDLIFPGHRHLPIASLAPEIAAQTITLMAPSKTFNIPGLGCSFAIIQNAELREAFQKSAAGFVHGANLLGYVAAAAAYQEGQEWLDQVLAYLKVNRDLVHTYVTDHFPGARTTPPEGTYLAWLDFRNTPIADKPAAFFLKHARVGLNEGAQFGPGGEGFARLNFACPRTTLVQALDQMRIACQ